MSARDVESRPSPIAGLGLFAKREFVPSERIAPYSGTMATEPPPEASPGAKVYALEIAPGRWLDGSSADNLSRHANHACHPNAELIWHEEETMAWLTAQRPIAAAEEITFDYGFSLAESLFHPCACGAADCVGRIIAAPSARPSAATCVFHVQGIDHSHLEGQFSQVNQPISMKKVPLTELDPRLQKQITAADQQLKANPQYAVEVLTGILVRNPGCIEVRRTLRKAQKALHGTKKGLFDGITGALTSGKIAKAVEADPLAAIAAAEEVLAKKPIDANANKTIALAAIKLEFHELAAFAYEELCTNEPTEIQHFVDLANVWIAAGENDNALNAADRGLKLFPGNGDLQEAVRKASVNKTMKKGNWEDKGDFQSKLKDKDEALRLDQSARTVTDSATALVQAAELAQKIQASPDSLDLYRDIVRMFLVAEDLDSSIAWLQRGRLTTLGKADSSLERQESDLFIRRYERNSKQLREAITANPADTASKEALAKNETELNDFRLKTSIALVERYPNDYGYRYELGTLLLAANRLEDAVQQLQYAQRNPKFRQPALLAIGLAFTQGGKFDLAIEQLTAAKSEVQMMNDLKKEIIYALGDTFEKMGKAKEAVDEYKIIYMADSGYRDVAKKINDFYERQKGATA